MDRNGVKVELVLVTRDPSIKTQKQKEDLKLTVLTFMQYSRHNTGKPSNGYSGNNNQLPNPKRKVLHVLTRNAEYFRPYSLLPSQNLYCINKIPG